MTATNTNGCMLRVHCSALFGLCAAFAQTVTTTNIRRKQFSGFQYEIRNCHHSALKTASFEDRTQGRTTQLSSGGAPVSCGPEKRIMPRRLLQRLVPAVCCSAWFNILGRFVPPLCWELKL
jgi:hypothetical protein